jgi:O-antigen/teichoic acid export membrane protein
MINRIKPKSSFVRNVLVLTTGTTIAQAVALAITPILTRIYTPEEFGVFSVYIAIMGLLLVFATGRYEHAIMLPSNDEDAINIVGLIVLIAFIFSFFILMVLLIADNMIAKWIFGDENLKSLLYFLPISLLISGSAQALNYWSNRKSKYKLMASSRMLRSSATGAGQLFLNKTGLQKIGLIGGYIFGEIILLGTLWKKLAPDIVKLKSNLTLSRMLYLSKRYSNFPKYDLLATLFNQGSRQLMVIFFGVLFGAEVAGYYGLTQRVLAAPLAFIGTAFLDVFKQRAAESYASTGSCRDIYVKVFKLLVVISFIPFLMLFLYGEELFSFVFGPEWGISGQYAQVLALMLLFQFVASPLSYVLYIAEKQHINLFGQTLLLIASAISIFIGVNLSSVDKTLNIYAISMSFVYIFYLFVSYKFSS